MTAVAAAQAERIRLDVEGMTCASCAARIERKLNKLEGVEATVNYATDQAAITYDPDSVTIDDLVAAVEAAGYNAALPGDARETDRAGALKLRLAVAALLSVPLALLAMVPLLQFTGWEWVAFALATPVVLWAGWSFHRAAFLNAIQAAMERSKELAAGDS